MKLDTLFKALGDQTRLRLLNLMSAGEVCVCFFVEVLGEAQPKISRHLAYLRDAGIVEARRDGKWAHYRIATLNGPATAILNCVLDSLREDHEMQRDVQRLERVCCSPR